MRSSARAIESCVATAPTVMGFVRAGRLKALAVSSRNASPAIPGVPGAEAAGLPGWRHLLHGLTRAGYLVFRVEKPGVGDSRGPDCSELEYRREVAGYIAGLPVGLSFFAGAFEESKLIRIGFAFDQKEISPPLERGKFAQPFVVHPRVHCSTRGRRARLVWWPAGRRPPAVS